MLHRLRNAFERHRLPLAARAAVARDASGLSMQAPDAELAIGAGLEWLLRAQAHSRSADGGVARDYSLIDGWASSYPETTGYIVPTLIEQGKCRSDLRLIQSTRQMLDWLVSIQFPDGGFQGGKIDATPRVPVTFNTGQILLGLAAGLNEFGAYEDATRRAADWLVRTQDDDGCWRGYPSPFASPGVKVYETHVAWGLFEAERALPGRGYLEAGLKQVRWALGFQRDNGWFAECCLSDSQRPLTHTLGYALRGVLEAHRSTGDDVFLQAGRLCADGMLSVLGQDGRLPGCLDADWQPAASWVCLTGAVQTAYCWLYLFENTGDFSYLSAARRANHFVRRTVEMQGPEGVAGGVKGSFPVDGEYGRFEYLSWAVKFAIDSWHYENRLAGTND